MGEISINPKFNIHETYKKVRILNPYRNLSGIIMPTWAGGLVSYYKMDETSGNQVIDSWGGNHGTNNGATIGVAGKIGSAVLSDGSSSNISIENSISATKATFNCWLKLNNHTPAPSEGLKTGLAYLNTSTFSSHYPYTDGDIYLGLLNSTRQTIPSSANIIADRTQWHMLTITSNTITGVYKVYQNAQLVYTGTVSSFSIASNITLLKSTANGSAPSYYLDGSMDEISLFDIDKNEGEISDIYNNGNGTTI